jgi:XTP/dITP diphosphohydrolase
LKLVLASHNKHKLVELAEILEPLVPGLELVGYDGPEPKETGSSFLENALIKARAAFSHTGLPAMADDSGLMVEIMGGSPGIFSARWSGAKDDALNRELLLKQLEDIPLENRSASFICTIALVNESGEHSFTGVWPGTIAEQAFGDQGFGYDPIFIPEGLVKTAAELDPSIKNALSHRAMALSQLAEYLRPQ